MYVMRRDKCNTNKKVTILDEDEHLNTGGPKKSLLDCMKDEMRIKGVSTEMTSDSRKWKTRCTDPT
jgi:hypothetical protein